MKFVQIKYLMTEDAVIYDEENVENAIEEWISRITRNQQYIFYDDFKNWVTDIGME